MIELHSAMAAIWRRRRHVRYQAAGRSIGRKEDRNRNMIAGGRDGAGLTQIKAAAAPVSRAAGVPRRRLIDDFTSSPNFT